MWEANVEFRQKLVDQLARDRGCVRIVDEVQRRGTEQGCGREPRGDRPGQGRRGRRSGEFLLSVSIIARIVANSDGHSLSVLPECLNAWMRGLCCVRSRPVTERARERVFFLWLQRKPPTHWPWPKPMGQSHWANWGQICPLLKDKTTEQTTSTHPKITRRRYECRTSFRTSGRLPAPGTHLQPSSRAAPAASQTAA